jgi:hypothetical protein
MAGICPPFLMAALAVTMELPRVGADPGFLLVAILAVLLTVEGIRQAVDIGRRGAASTGSLTRLLFIGLVTMLVGAGWFLASAYRIATELGTASGSARAALAPQAVADFGVSATVLAAALLVGIAAGFAWCGLANRIGAREQAESAALLAG